MIPSVIPLVESVVDLTEQQQRLRDRPYGMIEVACGELMRIQLKPWPKIGSVVEAKWIRGWKNQRRPFDVCQLYYNQPIGHRNYLTLAYIESSINTSLASVFRALDVLDQIAFIKRSDAILTEVINDRISDRLLKRLGWERHLEHLPRRHWIKRFYGDYRACRRVGQA